MNCTVLIVEDEPRLSEVLSDYFKSKGDTVFAVFDGQSAIDMAEEREFDAVLLDIMMPCLDGFSVCRAIRKNSDVPIIFLTALSAEEDKLYGYELGADDYMTKPFSMSVLYAKTMALVKRRRGNMMTSDKIECGGITVNLSSQKVYTDGKELTLTPKEYALLRCLMLNRNIVMSREQLLVKCWGYDYEGDARAVDTHIKRLREKLGDKAACIKTVIKAGYRMEG